MSRTKLTIQIVMLFGIIILASFIPDNFHEFFGDWHCEGGYTDYVNGNYVNHGCQYTNDHEATWHYGFRHWIWAAMGVVLFIVNIVHILEEANKNGDEN